MDTTAMDVKFLQSENDKLTTQIAALRMCVTDLRDVINVQCHRHKETPVGRTHKILNVDVPKVLRDTA